MWPNNPILETLFAEEISPEEIRAKKSELRLYCDLLMQQVQTVKSSVANNKEPDVEVSWLFYYSKELYIFYAK
jgi:uncharacterized Rmd1/YagE family protein